MNSSHQPTDFDVDKFVELLCACYCSLRLSLPGRLLTDAVDKIRLRIQPEVVRVSGKTTNDNLTRGFNHQMTHYRNTMVRVPLRKTFFSMW
jgi:hypothetical protein